MHSRKMKLCVLICLALCGFMSGLAAEQLVENPAEWDAGPVVGAALDKAQFRWWAPAGAQKLTGVIVLIPGRNGDGRALADDPAWQQIATSLNVGLMGCFLYGEKDFFKYQSDPTGDVAKTINDAVEKLALQNGFKDMKRTPLVFWGHSAGACVNEVYASRFPERVAAVINLKGPRGAGSLVSGKEDVPFLIIVGKNDKPDWVKSAVDSFDAAQRKNSSWTLAVQPSEGHEQGNSLDLIRAYLQAVIPLRIGLPPIGTPTSTSSRPRKLVRTQGWLGDPETYEASSYAAFTGKKRSAIWLPNEATALAWQSFLRSTP